MNLNQVTTVVTSSYIITLNRNSDVQIIRSLSENTYKFSFNSIQWRNERWAVQMAASHSQAARAKQERMLAFTDMETSLILCQIHMAINAALVVVVIVMGVLQMKKHL